MHLPFSLFLALKYLKPRRNFLSAVNVLCVLGISLGVAVLVIVIPVMSGFHEMWKEKLLSFNPHIIVSAMEVMEDAGPIYDQVEKVKGVVRAVPFIQSLVVLEHHGMVHPPYLRGVDPARDTQLDRLLESVRDGEKSLEDGGLLMGIDLARTLGVRAGDEVTVFTPQSIAGDNEIRLPDELAVTGVFELGMWQVLASFTVGF